MSFIARVRRRVGLRIAGVSAVASSIPENFRKWFTPTNIFARLRSTSLTASETFFAGVSKLSNSMGTVSLGLVDAEYREQSTPASDVLLHNPNPNMHFFELIRLLETFRNTAGNAYALKNYGPNYQVSGYWPLDPTRVEPVIEKTSRELWYQIEGDPRADGREGRYFVHNMDMIHVKHVYADIGYKGTSPLTVLTGAMDFDTKVREFSLDQLENSVRASFILNMATMMDEEKRKNVLDAFKAFYSENGGVLLEEAGTKITQIEQQFAIDTKAFETDKVTRKRVAEVLGLPDPDATGYNSREQEALRYVQETLLPIAKQYQAEFDRKVLTLDERKRGMRFRFNLYALLQADMATQGDFFFKMVRTGAFTPNNVLNLMGRPGYEGGDVHYVSRDLSPVERTTPL